LTCLAHPLCNNRLDHCVTHCLTLSLHYARREQAVDRRKWQAKNSGRPTTNCAMLRPTSASSL
jgi:hypothetical protein